MANSTFTMTFEVREDGSLVRVQQNIGKAGKAVKDLGAAQEAGAKSAKKHNDAINGGVSSANNSARGMSKLLETVGGNNSGLVAAYATLATNAFAVSAAFNLLRNATQVEQLMKGLEVQGNRTGKTLEITANNIQAIAKGGLSAADALKATALMSSAGLAKKDMEDLTQVAINASVALGRNLPDSLDRITKGVVKLEPELLDELGLMTKLTEASTNYARENQKTVASLSGMEKRVAFLQAIKKEGELKFGGIVDQVGINTFDKLAATFSNLITNSLNLINSFGPLKFVINSLADSTVTLLGALTLFGSTISGPLIKSMRDLHDRLDAQSEKLKASAAAQREKTEATLADAKANAAAARAAFTDRPTGRAPEAYKKGFDQFKQGTASAQQYDAAIKGLTSSSARFTNELAKLEAAQKAGAVVDAERISRLETVILLRDEQIQQLKVAKAAEAELSAQSQAVHAEQLAEMATEAQGRKTGAAAKALEHAQNFELVKSTKKIGEAVKEYSKQLKAQAATAAASGTAMSVSWKSVAAAWDAAKVAGYGLSLSIKAIGTSILAALPWLGLATVVIGLLMDLWEKYGKSKGQKALEKAYDDLGTVLDAVGDKLKELDRLQTADITIGQRAAKSAQIRSNAIQELGDAYQNVREVSKKNRQEAAAEQAQYEALTKSLAEQQKAVNMANAMAAGEGAMPVYTDLAAEALASQKKLAESAGASITSPIVKWFDQTTLVQNKFSKETTSTIKTLAALTKMDAQVAVDFEKLAKGAKNEADVLEAADTVIQKYTKSNTSLSIALGNLSMAMDSAETAQQSFIQSLVPSTVFDKAKAEFDNLTTSIRSVKKLMTEKNKDQFNEMLSGLGDELRKTLELPQQAALETVDALGSRLTKLKKTQEDMGTRLGDINDKNSKAFALDKDIKSTQNEINTILGEQSDKIVAQLDKYDSLLADAQKASILNQGRLAMAQAELEVINRHGILTSQNLKRQIDQQNRIKKIQADAAVLNTKFLEIEIAKEESQIAQIKNKKRELVENKKLEDSLQRQQLLTEQMMLSYQIDAKTKKPTAEAQARIDEITNILKGGDNADFNKFAAGLADSLDRDIEALDRAVATRRAAISAAQMQANAILKGIIGSQEASLLLQEIDIKNNATEIKQNLNLLKLQQDRKDAEDRINDKLAGRQSLLADEIKDLKTAQMQEGSNLLTTTGEQLAEQQRLLGLAQLNNDESQKRLINERIKAIKDEYVVNVDLLNLKYKEQILDKLIIDTTSKGLEIQQKSLEVVQKYISLQEELNSQKDQTRRLDAEIAAKRTGTEVSPEVSRRLDILAARESLKTAEENLSIKLEGIKLEYSLLEAQRIQAVLNWKMQRSALEMTLKANNQLDSNAQLMLDQMDVAIGNLSKMTYTSLEKMAEQSARNEVEIKRKQLQLAETRSLPNMGPAADVLAGISNFIQILAAGQRERTLGAANTGLVGKSALPNLEEMKQQKEQEMRVALDKLSQVISVEFPNQVKALEDLAASLKTTYQAGSAATPGMLKSTMTAQDMTAAIAAKVAVDPRLRVGEIGATEGHKKGSMHGLSRAFDVNVIGSNGPEALDPAAKAILDKRAVELAKTGMEVLWNGLVYDFINGVVKTSPIRDDDKHLDHLHAEIDSQSYARMQKMYATMGAAATSGVERAAADVPVAATVPTPSTQAANDNQDEIVVTGSKMPDWLIDTGPLVDTSDLLKDIESQLGSLSTTTDKVKLSFGDWFAFAIDQSKPLISLLNTLGPQGEAQARVIQGIQQLGTSIIDFGKSGQETFAQYTARMTEYNTKLAETGQQQVKVATEGQFHAQKMADGFAMAASVIGSVASILKSASDANIAGIDKEIAAEEKRDGKSAASVAKIEALEKKKDAAARKAFNLNKKLMMAQAVMSTAAGVAGALAHTAELGPVGAAIMAGIIGAMGIAQVALIAGTQYESSYTPKAATMPTNLSIGKRSDTVDLAKGPNASAGGEVGYIRGSEGYGSNASNYRTVGSAYGGELMRGYGNRGFVVGEKGPEVITPDTPITVTPANDVGQAQAINAHINIQALDSQGVQDVLVSQKGNIIKMLRQAANASGKTFMEDVNVNVYTRPSVGKL